MGVPNLTQVFSQNFDGVSAPALPAGWTSAITGSGTAWATSTAQRDTLPNSVFAADPAVVTDNQLTSPSIAIGSANGQLTFRHDYNTETGQTTGYDGGVLEISINGGAFSDIVSAGGTFVSGGYNNTISPDFGNPLAGRSAWSGSSGGFITTTVNLPPAAAGQNIRLRWRLGSDSSVGMTGWYVDTIAIAQFSYSCCSSLVPPLIVNPRRVGSNSIAFSYSSVAGQSYVVETKTNLSATNWTAVQTNAGDGSLKSYTNSTTTSPQRFFRLRTQ